VSSPPTLPFTKDQMVSILAACPKYSGDAQRLRAFTLLLRYSGMRIGDTATCARDRLNGRRLLLYMQRTSEPVFVVLPQFVVDALDAMSPISERYFFWTGEGDRDTVAGNWRRTLRKIFKAAGVKGGTLIVFGTRSQWTCCLPASLWNRFQSCSDMAASGSRRSTIRHGFATGRRNWKPAWNAHGHRIPWFSPRRRVRQRYTANEMLSIN